jgi:hypothetical protein
VREGGFEVVEEREVGGGEDAVTCQHYASLHVHTHRHQGLGHLSQILILLCALVGSRTRRHSALIGFRRLILDEDGSD